MTYFLYLPAFVLALIIFDVVSQQLLQGIVDLEATSRVALLGFVAWSLWGWREETKERTFFEESYEWCYEWVETEVAPKATLLRGLQERRL